MLKPAVQPAGRIHLHLIVSDMKRSIDFYVTVLGFFYDHGVREIAWLTREGLLLTLSPGNARAGAEQLLRLERGQRRGTAAAI